jgi:hypothetical protein
MINSKANEEYISGMKKLEESGITDAYECITYYIFDRCT